MGGAASTSSDQVVSSEDFAAQAKKLHELSLELAEKEKEIQDLKAKLVDSNPKGVRSSIVDISTQKGENARNSVINRIENVRRGEVSAEVAMSLGDNEPDLAFPKQEKEPRIEELIRTAVDSSLLFQGLREEEKKDLTQAFFQVNISEGENAIKEGDVGDNFYVVEKGELEVLVTITSANENSQVCYGSLQEGSSFGELALMYNTPRAATIKAKTECVLWAIQRQVFSKIHLYHKKLRAEQYEKYLKNVPQLSNLTPTELSRLANAVEESEFEPGSVIIREGEVGDHFYIIVEGEVIYSKLEEGEVGRGKQGDYFGHKALLTEEKRKATVTTVSQTTCLTLSRAEFVALLGALQELLDRGEIVNAQEEDAGKEDVIKYYKDIRFEDLQRKFKHRGREREIVLGQGAFGKVQIVKHNTTGETYALKCLNKTQIVNNKLQNHVYDERKVMTMIDHPFALKLHNSYWDKKNVYFLLELCLGGELFTLLRKKQRFNEKTAKFYCAAVLLVFGHMHDKNIIYRDLKPENIMLDNKGYAKVVDFGLAKKVPTKTYTLCGTPDYLAPEIITSKGHDKAVDYWALGVLIYELVVGYAPYYSSEPMNTYELILKGEIHFPHRMTKPITNLIQQLNNINQAQRLGNNKEGLQGIVKHIWFSGFDWEGLMNKTLDPPHKPKVSNAEDTSNFDDYPEEHQKVKDCSWEPDFPYQIG